MDNIAFNGIIDKYRLDSYSERAKGDKFEQIIKAYFFTDPKYSDIVKQIWLWEEFPYKSQFGTGDSGIDLVILAQNGEYWAVQCKCVADGTYIDKPAVDSFLATSGRSFEVAKGDIFKFAKRIWVSTTNNWSSNATETLKNQTPQIIRINLYDLETAPVDWDKLENLVHGMQARTEIWDLKPHQKIAVDSSLEYFNKNDRGKLIMACGTGKTFTALRVAEAFTNGNGLVLFLVPSIALLSQTLREWTAQAKAPIDPICICSDPEVSKEKKNSEDTTNFSVIDLALPASTSVSDIKKQLDSYAHKENSLKVVFSTYQSLDVISKAQKEIGFEFDLIICDEAHRTTGVTLANADDSSFVKVHKNDYIKSRKRLYMTATPRLYGEDSKRKAEQASAEICSMDDESLYGREIYRIGFGMAVDQGLLTDYKVLVLTLSENDVTREVQNVLSTTEKEIVGINDVSKLIGCINAMSKQILSEKGTVHLNDPEPMRRAIAFASSIQNSRQITNTFDEIKDTYFDSVPELKKNTLVKLHSKHIDGSMSATSRDELMSWLKKEPVNRNEARVLTNVRCLSEGVDVPSLDAVMFLTARNSQVDVVQSVGRVMRKSPGKKYGYIIIPIVIPNDVTPEEALNDNERFRVVWTVLNALRAHDDRFNALINKIDLNKNRPSQVIVGRADPDGDGDPFNDSKDSQKLAQAKLPFQFDALQQAIYAKMVQKVGERQYWENWAKDIADIANRHIKRISKVVEDDDEAHMAFREFVRGLRKNINPSVTEAQAIEMLSQHIITKPVFDALFEGFSFVKHNPVSLSMQKALDAIEKHTSDPEELEKLEAFYNSVKRRAEGVDNAEGKQRIIVELYDKFFKTGFPKLVEQLGIVYTPIEVVDFIIHSVNDVLKKEFGKSLGDKNVNIIDPFTGTGTFITRLLQSRLINKEDLERKYKNEIFANEIVLLAYYIAAVNIENTYHDILGKKDYDEFPGIVLTDTFQLYEDNDKEKLFSNALPDNSERLQRQINTPLKVIISNPPYSVGQRSANDNAQNQKYKTLDGRISSTYAKLTNATNKNSLYDSYIKAFRWATDRLGKDGGVIGFVSNGSWIDGNAQDGMRKTLEKEFTSIHIFNTRGNARTSGEIRQREAGNVFGGGSRTPISITILVKNPQIKVDIADIYYHDIGDNLNREQKLQIIKDFGSIDKVVWKKLIPNEHGDWINLRNDSFSEFIPLEPEKKYSSLNKSFFITNSNGLKTQRDAWCYNSSFEVLWTNIFKSVKFYNSEVNRLKSTPKLKRKSEINFDPSKFSWSDSLINGIMVGKDITDSKNHIRKSLYRPFFKQNVYYDKLLNERTYQFPSILPIDNADLENIIICTPGAGDRKESSIVITNLIPDLGLNSATQCFPLYYYEKLEKKQQGLFEKEGGYIRHDGISNFIWNKAKNHYGDNVRKEDIFYYVYGFLHSPDYRHEFRNDLMKMLPRLPLVEVAEDFWAFSKAGRELADLHINYEKVPAYPNVKVTGTQHKNYLVEKMKFVKKGDKSKIIYNNQITIENIPDKAYEYVINGRSAIEWIMDRYQIKKDKDSGIINDPNDWSKEVKNPRYILDLLLSVINVSVKTVDIVNDLPKLTFK